MDDAWRDEEETGGSNLLNYLPIILWQHRWYVVTPIVLCLIAGIVAALVLPTTYRSSATLLVESQELPEQIVGKPLGDLIDQRIAKIRQQVLSRGDLVELIEQNGLYDRERQKEPMSTIVEQMRNATTIEAVSAEIGQKKDSSNTIAFKMSFDYREPVKAQVVMQVFVDNFLKLDATALSRQAGTTVQFLDAQARELQSQIASIEGQITSIKSNNGAALASTGLATSSNLGSYDSQIAALQRDNAVAMQQARTVTKDPIVAAAEAQLASTRAVYSETHPDVVVAKQRLEEARRLAAANPNDSARNIAQAQIAANNAQISALGRARAIENARSTSVSAVQSRAPALMETVAQLENKAAVLRAQYQDVSTRLLGARNAERMTTEDKGERLSVTDPPQVPEEPLSPNRPLLVLGGLIAGIGIGFVLALLVELVNKPIRGASALEKVLRAPPLGIIPKIQPVAIKGASNATSGKKVPLWKRRSISEKMNSFE